MFTYEIHDTCKFRRHNKKFLYEACAPYRRYGQGFKCSVCSSTFLHPVLTIKHHKLKKKQSVFTLCFLTKPATCCFAALLRSLSAHFASRPARISDTARRSDTEIAHFTQLQLQCKMRQRSLSSRRRKAA